MSRRLLQFLVALGWCVWVFFIIPAHTRGAISLGTTCADCGPQDKTPLFFGSVKPACCQNKSSNAPAAPTKSSGNCAICHLVASTLNMAPTPPMHLFLHLLEILPPVTPSGAVHFFDIRPYQSRAPPVASIAPAMA